MGPPLVSFVDLPITPVRAAVSTGQAAERRGGWAGAHRCPRRARREAESLSSSSSEEEEATGGLPSEIPPLERAGWASGEKKARGRGEERREEHARRWRAGDGAGQVAWRRSEVSGTVPAEGGRKAAGAWEPETEGARRGSGGRQAGSEGRQAGRAGGAAGGATAGPQLGRSRGNFDVGVPEQRPALANPSRRRSRGAPLRNRRGQTLQRRQQQQQQQQQQHALFFRLRLRRDEDPPVPSGQDAEEKVSPPAALWAAGRGALRSLPGAGGAGRQGWTPSEPHPKDDLEVHAVD
ncbi:uncharacterized protein LOC112542922 [Python bivittatus]|uniref:Uncharacterized protein LOC112542922 n=1 Tax=Python bivittatus TaxID=176946 RepID=A0A9F5N030_PYTBI|nr:uncharacterized protein LOC112542922 [Python bivittatus]